MQNETKYYCSKCKLSVIMLPEQEPIKACKCEAPIIAECSAVVFRQGSELGVKKEN